MRVRLTKSCLNNYFSKKLYLIISYVDSEVIDQNTNFHQNVLLNIKQLYHFTSENGGYS